MVREASNKISRHSALAPPLYMNHQDSRLFRLDFHPLNHQSFFIETISNMSTAAERAKAKLDAVLNDPNRTNFARK